VVTVPAVARSLAALGIARPLDHDPADLRERAADLLSRPPYAPDEPGVLRLLLDRVGRAIAEFLDRLTFAIGEVGWFGWAVVVVALLVLGALVWRVTRGTTLDASVAARTPDTAGRSASDWHAEADRLEAAGELEAALRTRYAAIVAELVEAAVLEDVPGRTVRELDAEVAVAAPRRAPSVAAVGERFDAVVYGGRPATLDDLEVARAATWVAVR
jgi:hypothetical protein